MMPYATCSTVEKISELIDIGTQLQNCNDWQQAAVAFERGLAHIPNYLGVRPWCQRYFLDDEVLYQYSPEAMGDIYSELSKCRYRVARFDDSLQLAEVALRMAPNCRNARLIKERCIDKLCKQPVDHIDTPSKKKKRVAPDSSYADQLSIVIFTNLTNKIHDHKELTPPSLGLVKATFGAAVQTFGDAIMNCKKWLSYDRPRKDSPESRQYEENLSNFADEFGFDFKPFKNEGLQSIVSQLIEHINTPYLLFLEHDQFFKASGINLSEIISLLDRHHEINTVRFNKRTNIIHNFDYLLSNERRFKTTPLLQTSAYSNMPQVLRVSTLKDRWLPVCFADPMINKMELRGTAIGIEEPLFKKYMMEVRQWGFDRAHENWGTYLYGGYNHPASVVHLGEMVLKNDMDKENGAF